MAAWTPPAGRRGPRVGVEGSAAKAAVQLRQRVNVTGDGRVVARPARGGRRARGPALGGTARPATAEPISEAPSREAGVARGALAARPGLAAAAARVTAAGARAPREGGG